MRHHLSGRQLSRNSAHRKALMRALASALLREETIQTTLPKAKELRRVVEPLITIGKQNTQAGRRRAFAQLRDAALVEKLFTDIAPRYQSRAGGYTRILKMEPRAGDNAPMALMQLVEGTAEAARAAEGAPKKAAAEKAPKKAAARKKTTTVAKPRRRKAAAD